MNGEFGLEDNVQDTLLLVMWIYNAKT